MSNTSSGQKSFALIRILAVYKHYIEARSTFLDELQLKGQSNREPLVEFSECMVAALVDGTLADSRVQKGWDVKCLDGEKIQVKSLMNPSEQWINGHEICVNEGMDSYAIVIFEAFLPKAVIIFPARNLKAVGNALGKRHKNLDTTLQFTRANYRAICNDVSKFSNLGVRLYLPPDWDIESN